MIGRLRTRSISTPACSENSENGSASSATRMPICARRRVEHQHRGQRQREHRDLAAEARRRRRQPHQPEVAIREQAAAPMRPQPRRARCPAVLHRSSLVRVPARAGRRRSAARTSSVRASPARIHVRPTTPRELIIQGVTRSGDTFRPSDWAERLCGVLAAVSTRLRRHPRPVLGYSPYVQPTMIGGIRCVVVDPRLHDLEPRAWDFVVGFARDNELVTHRRGRARAAPTCRPSAGRRLG